MKEKNGMKGVWTEKICYYTFCLFFFLNILLKKSYSLDIWIICYAGVNWTFLFYNCCLDRQLNRCQMCSFYLVFTGLRLGPLDRLEEELCRNWDWQTLKRALVQKRKKWREIFFPRVWKLLSFVTITPSSPLLLLLTNVKGFTHRHFFI